MLNNTHGSGSQPEQQALSQSYNHRLKVTDSETHTQQTDFYSDEEEAWVSPVPRAVLVCMSFDSNTLIGLCSSILFIQ